MKVGLELLQKWARRAEPCRQARFGEVLGDGLTIDIPLDPTPLLRKFYRQFEEKFGLDLSIYSIDELRQNRRKTDGARIGKVLSQKLPTELRGEFVTMWDAWQFVLRPTHLRITANPLELLLISENTTGWTTCSSLDGSYFWGPIAYAFDSFTVVAYAHCDSDPDVFFGVAPRKFWRVLIYWPPENEHVLLVAREYPRPEKFFFSALLEHAARIFLNCSSDDLLELNAVALDFDTLEFGPYIDPVRIFVPRGAEKPKYIRLSWVLPREVEWELEEAAGAVCDVCGARMDPDFAYFVGDTLICEACFNEHAAICEKCGQAVWRTDLVDADGMWVCSECAEKLPKCASCGFPTYDPKEWDDEQYCSICAENVKIICENCWQEFPITHAKKWDGHIYCDKCYERLLTVLMPLPF